MFDNKKAIAGTNINTGKYILFVILAILGAYFATYFINKLIPDFPIADFGIPLLTITILLAGFITYRYLVANHKLDKKDFVGLLVFMVIVFVAVVYFPQWFPNFFAGDVALSRIIDSTDLLKSTMGLP